MISIGANGEKIHYGIKHYNVDTEQDLQNLPKYSELMGSTCFVISTSKYYMLNSEYQWVEIKPFGKGGNSSGGGGDNPPLDPDNIYIYDGGLIL